MWNSNPSLISRNKSILSRRKVYDFISESLGHLLCKQVHVMLFLSKPGISVLQRTFKLESGKKIIIKNHQNVFCVYHDIEKRLVQNTLIKWTKKQFFFFLFFLRGGGGEGIVAATQRTPLTVKIIYFSEGF